MAARSFGRAAFLFVQNVSVLQGIDVLRNRRFAELSGKRIGLLCNQASICRNGTHTLDALLSSEVESGIKIHCVFGPQHGMWGHTQDNMIEWEGYRDPRTDLPFYSLYGERREPTREQLRDLDVFVIDIPDVGARYYTFIWTMALCIKACSEIGLPILVLDRVNPIGGKQVEGTVLEPEYASFVGLHPLPMRHGMTVGEIALHFQSAHYPSANVKVVELRGWNRAAYFDETDLMWAPPSPNMPTVDTAVLYPGACLLEGTNLSEGRGTTRPFEMVGAPFLDGWELAQSLSKLKLKGVFFRPIQFQPTFQKFAGEQCGGVFVHVTDRKVFEPVTSYVSIIQAAHELSDGRFQWKSPPYEYETQKMPFDILAGNPWLREAIEGDAPLSSIRDRMVEESSRFAPIRASSLSYR